MKDVVTWNEIATWKEWQIKTLIDEEGFEWLVIQDKSSEKEIYFNGKTLGLNGIEVWEP